MDKATKKHKTNLQAMRVRAGFKSAREFAEHIGVNVGTYTNYEQGKVALSLLKAWEFADALDCTIDELAGRRVPDRAQIDSAEQHVIDCYRSTDARGKAAITRTAEGEAGVEGQSEGNRRAM